MNPNACVFVVDDDNDFRQSLCWLLEGEGFQVEGFASAESFLSGYQGQMGCLLLDIRMPEISGLALQQKLNERAIQLPVIILTGHGDVPMAVTAMKQGAVDFIEKPFDDEALLAMVRQNLKLAEQRFAALSNRAEIDTLYQTLSRREKQVMALVIEGNVNREIAEQLGISPKTVEVHRSRVMSKMRADSLPELVQQAATLGLN